MKEQEIPTPMLLIMYAVFLATDVMYAFTTVKKNGKGSPRKSEFKQVQLSSDT